jgi:hypothetical protein
MDDFLFFLIILVVCIGIFSYFSSRNSSSTSDKAAEPDTAAQTKDQMAYDIKATKTSRIVDAVEILDELGAISQGHRQYCELVGTSMPKSGVIAPYSQREVAYYDIRCYRIESKAGVETETLIAHETSIDPFYFKDGSCDTPVYVDLKSFGKNVILVNSTNHIEGPNSEFAKAASSHLTATGGAGGAMAVVGEIRERAEVLGVEAKRFLDWLIPAPVAGLALAGAGADGSTLPVSEPENLMFAQGYGKINHGGSGSQPRINVNVGYGVPRGLGDFMGGNYYGRSHVPGGYGVPRSAYNYGTTMGDLMLNIGLGALLGTLSNTTVYTTPQTTRDTTARTPQTTLRGYRLVEDVVPLNSPIYCIGELYHVGTDVYMGRSLDENYPTSYFATKPEAEVLASLKS